MALARLGSLSAAARMLSVNHATISRKLHPIEESVCEKLVERRPTWSRLHRSLGVGCRTGAEWLGADQRAARPLVRLSCVATTDLVGALSEAGHRPCRRALRSVSLEWHEADTAIHFDEPSDGDVIARPLTCVGLGFYGTDEVCRAAAAGDDPVFIGFNEAVANLYASTWMAIYFPRARIAFRAKDQFLRSTVARTGAGLALIPHCIGHASVLHVCDLGVVPARRTRSC